MKAKVKATEEILEGDLRGHTFMDKQGRLFSHNDIIILDDVDYNQVRIQAAIAAMNGMISNPQTFEQLDHDDGYKAIRGGDKSQIVAIASVMYADALVKELKGD